MGQRKRISNQSYDTILKIIEGNRLGIIEVGPSKKHLQPRLRSSSTGNDFKEKESFERDEEEAEEGSTLSAKSLSNPIFFRCPFSIPLKNYRDSLRTWSLDTRIER